MTSTAGAQINGHSASPIASPQHSRDSPPRHSSALYPPAPAAAPSASSYGPTTTNNIGQFQYGAFDNNHPGGHDSGPAQSISGHNLTSDVPAAKPKQQRRKKATTDAALDTAADGKAESDSKPKQKRKPREPKDPNAPPKKRLKKEDKQAAMSGAHPGDQLKTSSMYPPATSSVTSSAPDLITYASPPDQFRAPPRPASSGQRYDPVRGVSIASDRSPSSGGNYAPVGLKSPVRGPPSIASLVEPTPPSNHVSSYPPRSTPSSSYGPAPNGTLPSQPPKPATSSHPIQLDGASPHELTSAPRKVNTPPRKLSPKPPKAKAAAPPPLPGAEPPLTNADFGRPSNRERKYEDVPNDCIVIDVPMNREGSGSYVNFLKEVENKYGFDVAHPRVAEHRKRMKEIAAAGAALESVPGSADEMNLDVSEGESDVEMGGQGEGSNSEGTKRKRKVNEKYDLDDDFIDDTEMVWQDQQLASRDGYFVWSGPLIQEGSKPTIERADGTVKRGGRGGRGGARGGTMRGDGTGKTRGTRGGGGPGSRGGTTVRKPRVTKADRAKMDAEKMERERMAASATKPTLYPGTS